MSFDSQLINQYHQIFHELLAKKIMVTCAESCTGGLLGSLFTEIDGSSKVFERGFITYSNLSKIEMLGVDENLIKKFGAVSEQVALAMAKGAIQNSKAQLAIAITGIAGPSGGTIDKQVGTVFIALVSDDYQIVKKFIFTSKNRQNNRESSVRESLLLIKNYLNL
ncbi:MAG: CinA family protein [Proteobacteria bacterium]|nr:CinA family protein [Pseudomonadota bacterium]NCA27923.1 CinA family protein [Pseudomonadota bacterium]